MFAPAYVSLSALEPAEIASPPFAEMIRRFGLHPRWRDELVTIANNVFRTTIGWTNPRLPDAVRRRNYRRSPGPGLLATRVAYGQGQEITVLVSLHDSHAYAGCKVSFPDGLPNAGEDVLAEFSDGVQVLSMIKAVSPDAYELSIPNYRTGRGTEIVANRWLLSAAGRAWKIAKKLQ